MRPEFIYLTVQITSMTVHISIALSERFSSLELINNHPRSRSTSPVNNVLRRTMKFLVSLGPNGDCTYTMFLPDTLPDRLYSHPITKGGYHARSWVSLRRKGI